MSVTRLQLGEKNQLRKWKIECLRWNIETSLNKKENKNIHVESKLRQMRTIKEVGNKIKITFSEKSNLCKQ